MNEIATENDINQLTSITQNIFKLAKSKGASEVECHIVLNKGFSVAAAKGAVETVEYHQDKSIEINVFFGKKSGSASMTDLRAEAVRSTVEAACHIAQFTDEDNAAGLAEKNELAFQYPQLQLAYDWPITVEEAIEIACQCERETLAFDKRIIRVEEANVNTIKAFSLYANSLGFMGYYPHTRHELSCLAIAKDKDEMQRDHAYTIAVDPAQLDSISHVAEMTATRSVKRLGARQIKTMKTPVIFAAEEARGLWNLLVAAISGSRLYKQASFLQNHLEKQIFPSYIHLQEKPFMQRALGSAPFDNEGVATRENTFIQEGFLKQYILSTYSARRLGMKTTGNAGGVHNLIVKSGNKNFADLIKTMHKGLVITELMGSGINLVTGDYSRGIGGFWVENGEIQFPVQEVTIAGRLEDMFMGIEEVGNDVDARGNIQTGSVLINEMMVAGS